jgi:hypothetical protein
METIDRIIDNIMFVVFLVIALVKTAIKPFVLILYIKVASFVACNILHNEELDNKIFKTGEDFFEPTDEYNQKFATMFSNTLCKMCNMFISIKGLQNIVQDFYYLKTRHHTMFYETLYETAIETFNN